MGKMYILASALGFGLTPSLIQLLLPLGFNPQVLAIIRFGIPCLMFMPFLFYRQQNFAETWRTLAIGAISGLGMLCYYQLFTRVPAAILILCYYTYPLFTIAIGYVAFGVVLTRNRLVAASLITIAIALTIQGDQETSLIGWQWVLVWFPPLSFALLINYFSRPIAPMPINSRMAASLFGTLTALIPVGVLLPIEKFLPSAPTEWLWILALGILSAGLPQYFFMKGSQTSDLESTTMISSLEVVFAMGLAYLLLQQPITQSALFSALLIVMASLIRFEEQVDSGVENCLEKQPPSSVLDKMI